MTWPQVGHEVVELLNKWSDSPLRLIWLLFAIAALAAVSNDRRRLK